MSESLQTPDWMAALNETLHEVATTALCVDSSSVLRTSNTIPDGLEGAYLALVGQQDSIQIGLASNAEGCQALARTLLQMEPDGPDVEPADVADAMCEIVNIMAGGIKARLHGKIAPITLGLPIFVKGAVQPSGRLVLLTAEVLIGKVPAVLIIIEPRGA